VPKLRAQRVAAGATLEGRGCYLAIIEGVSLRRSGTYEQRIQPADGELWLTAG